MVTVPATKEMRRKNFILPADLAGRAEEIAQSLGIDFSQFTREAIRQFIERIERESLEKQLEEACKNYRDFNKKFSPEWARFETRIK